LLIGVEYLLTQGLVHEQLSSASTLVNHMGEVKICDVEYCQQSGDVIKLFDSISRMMMTLMDKGKLTTSALGLTRPGDWSTDAVDFFTTTTSNPNTKKLLGHGFMDKRNKEELVWLISNVLLSAQHIRE
jgi:hypothetical protein